MYDTLLQAKCLIPSRIHSWLFLTHLGEERLHLLAELSGVVAKNIRIVLFAFNPARSYKDIIGLLTFYYVGNFWTFLQLLYLTVVKFGKAIRHCFDNKTMPSFLFPRNCNFYSSYFKLGWNTARHSQSDLEIFQPVV